MIWYLKSVRFRHEQMKWKKAEAVQTTESGTNFKKNKTKLTYLNSYMHFSGCLFQFVT